MLYFQRYGMVLKARGHETARFIAALGGAACFSPKSETSAAAEQKIGFHRAFTYDVDAAVRLEPKALVKVSMGCIAHQAKGQA
jgi:hypothetical protein